MESGRIGRKEYYLEIAKAVALRSPCIRAKYGAIVVKHDAIVSTGYNGPIRGGVNCYEHGCIKDILELPHGKSYDLCPAVHSEENAILNAARNGSSVLGGILYLYGLDPETGAALDSVPCDRCKRAIINAGIEKVVAIMSNGDIVEYDVSEWVRLDTRRYLSNLENAKKGYIKP